MKAGGVLADDDGEGVADEMRATTAISRVWSGRSSRSCRRGEGRLDMLRRRCTSGGNSVLVPLQI
jgi:hypothetical protein